eukprot:TRINITY_DN4287_c0_g1_i2.p1 TRINITY_DN4287_c0_g1~~TRINITY_DN4287_c0_g1_i2.p1  ORF type:complete len:242 (+),score=45.81 TRINITY_DN4287_c0_g1_i2:83-727(+)
MQKQLFILFVFTVAIYGTHLYKDPEPPVLPNQFRWDYTLFLPAVGASGFGVAYFDAARNSSWRFDEVYTRDSKRTFSFDVLWWIGQGEVTGAEYLDNADESSCSGGLNLGIELSTTFLKDTGCTYAGIGYPANKPSYIWTCKWNIPNIGLLENEWMTSIETGFITRWHIKKSVFAESYFDMVNFKMDVEYEGDDVFAIPQFCDTKANSHHTRLL